ncbi:hypothetical protein AB6H35_15945 [Citrobacter freundii]|uniref:hypothetical protein n=1 Tax=Citrobacter freundii TaxID=546 RepID=UPI000842296C|nr:hypothetical protein [Citrobacter freundii]AOI33016.1 hypothetical protein BFQ28_24560 [Citrobacter freundii]QAR68049.1 hypothetical protein C3B53_26415 [Citrobacter sp. SL156]
MTILQFLAIPWLFSVIFLYLTVVEIKNDNPRDAKLLGVICALAFLCAIFLNRTGFRGGSTPERIES